MVPRIGVVIPVPRHQAAFAGPEVTPIECQHGFRGAVKGATPTFTGVGGGFPKNTMLAFKPCRSVRHIISYDIFAYIPGDILGHHN